MNRALWLLLNMQMRGWLRYLGRNLKTLRGALLMLVGLAVFLPFILVVFQLPVGGGVDPTTLRRYGPASLLLYCFANVLFSSNERAIYFTPAEVQMLFAGPFGRREVLAYKILLTLVVTLPATLFMAAIVRVRAGWAPAVLSGLFMLGIFMQLFAMVLGLLANALGARLYSRGRKIVAGLALVLVIALILQSGSTVGWQPSRWSGQLFETSAWKIISWPLQAFFDSMRATRLAPDLLVPLGIALSVNIVLIILVFALDRHYQESSAAASARIYARIQRMRGRSAGAETSAPTRRRRLDVPDLPWWGGIGPILWRQLTTALGGLGRIVFVLCLLCGALALPLAGTFLEEETAIVPGIVFLGMWISFFLTGLTPFDFRGDIDRIGILKTLPIAPWKLAIGQLLTPALMLTAIQYLGLAAAAVLSPPHAVTMLTIAVFVPPFNFVLVALENLLFLLFPVRLAAATPGDFLAVGRNVLLSLGKMFGLGIAGGMAAGVGFVVAFVTKKDWMGVAAAWPIVAGIGAGLIPLVSLAFKQFDVGRDTPA